MSIPKDLVLEGDRVRLEPVTAAHIPDLMQRCNDHALWAFTYAPTPFENDADAAEWLREATETSGALTFAIVDRASGATIGSTRYHSIDETNRKLEIGWTFLEAAAWRTGINHECKLLLMRYAFEEWNAVRVQFKANATNLRSRAALEGIGAVCEGTHRNFRIKPDGERNGVTFFSVIDTEWPAVRAGLQRSPNRNPISV